MSRTEPMAPSRAVLEAADPGEGLRDRRSDERRARAESSAVADTRRAAQSDEDAPGHAVESGLTRAPHLTYETVDHDVAERFRDDPLSCQGERPV